MPGQFVFGDLSDGSTLKYQIWGPRPENLDSFVRPYDEELLEAIRNNSTSKNVNQTRLDMWSGYIDEINSYGFRCDEFTDQHHGKKHILFLGDSNTFGVGLHVDEVWSKKLFDRINKDSEYSGYFNLGLPGASNFDLINNAFKYFKEFGMPDTVVVQLTEMSRFYAYDNNIKSLSSARFEAGNVELIKRLSYDYYNMFERFCDASGIRLISFTWDIVQDNNDKTMSNAFYSDYKFKSFYKINKYVLYKWLKENNKDRTKYWVTARDDAHYGIGHNEYWSRILEEEIAK